MIYAIGDIHGEAALLRDVLRAISENADSLGITRPTIVFLGDYIDRGPDSRGVLDILTSRELEERASCVFLRGNHEDALTLSLDRRDERLARDWATVWGGDATLHSYGVSIGPSWRVTLENLAAAMPAAHRNFLTGLALSHETEDCFFAHAGVDPGVPLDGQDPMTLLFGNDDLFNPLLWTAVDKLVVHGNFGSDVVEIHPHRVGLDTRAGFLGGQLSVVRISSREVQWCWPDEWLVGAGARDAL